MAYILKRKWKNKTTFRVQVTRKGFKSAFKSFPLEPRRRSGEELWKTKTFDSTILSFTYHLDSISPHFH